ncbi:MAG: polysaccharide deacetylase family protein [Isosphaeraceae bacterium]
MRNKREYLARLFGRIGLVRMMERLGGSRPGLVVLTYHRIAEPGADPFYDPVISATPESFRAQVEWLARGPRVLALDEAIERLTSAEPWREPAVLVTFDDGYRDNFDIAAPILRKRGIPATFFLPTAFLEEPRLPWWDRVACILKQTRATRLDLPLRPDGEAKIADAAEPLTIDLKETPRAEAIRAVIDAFLDGRIADESWFLGMLGDRAGVVVEPSAAARALFADWDQVRRLTGPETGLSVGSHGHSHRRLAGLDDETQRAELTGSRRILEDRLGRPVEALAYPYGWPGAFDDRTRSIAAEAGYRVAFASFEGINRPGSTDPFAVRRLGVGSGDSAGLLRARVALHGMLGRSFL